MKIAPLLALGAAVAAGPGVPVRHVETLRGPVTESHRADEAINPASVVKIVTSLWALERLGPEHRFETRFAVRGELDRESGLLEGELLVLGGGDPDFHVENAYLVARSLNRQGIRDVRGSLLVDGRFWIGWEGGAARREPDPRLRAAEMARRLRDAFDPGRWDAATRNALAEFRERRGWLDDPLPRVVVRAAGFRERDAAAVRVVAVHRSNPLRVTLKRLNAYSNNDIERLGDGLGTPREMAAFLGDRWGSPDPRPVFATHSGLGTNRMTCRQIVRLLRDLRETCDGAGLSVADILPATGCDPGTLTRFEGLAGAGVPATLVAKTGTLTETDGGIAVLAGYARTARGERLFCIASPGIGRDVDPARAAQERWLLGLFEGQGGARSAACGAGVVHSDADASVRAVDGPDQSVRSSSTRRSTSSTVL